MRFLPLLVALVLVACDPSAPCESLTLGQSAASLPQRLKVTTLNPGTWTMFGSVQQHQPHEQELNKGAVAEALCCLSKGDGAPLSWCTPEQLECSAPGGGLPAGEAQLLFI